MTEKIFSLIYHQADSHDLQNQYEHSPLLGIIFEPSEMKFMFTNDDDKQKFV